MNVSRVLASIAALFGCLLPCLGQEAMQEAQPAAAVTGTGTPNKVPVWRSSTALGSSAIWSIGGNVGIGTGTPAAKLEVNGNAQVDGNFSLNGSILENGAGQLLWSPNDISGNLSVGLLALPASTTGFGNSAFGEQALSNNTSGTENTAMGNDALLLNTNGSQNTAVGLGALFSNNTAGGNTAVGAWALGQNTGSGGNTAIGSGALRNSDGGGNNTANGEEALYSNAFGSNNVANGFQALYSNTSGGNNIALGYQAGYSVSIGYNNIDIGNQGTSTDSGVIRLGTQGLQGATYITGIFGVNVSGSPVEVSSSGQLGVVLSSRRYKQDIEDMREASSGLMRLRPVTFRYRKPYADGSSPILYGLIAEEVAEVYPDLVARSVDGQIESVRYQLLDPMLLNELQKQHVTIQTQKEQIRSLEDRLARIEAALGTTQLTAAPK